MKRTLWIIGSLIALSLPALGALRFGLGNAVAKRSAELINKAGAGSQAVGDNVAVTLDACPAGAIYDSPPTDLSQIDRIDPLGHVNPSGHTFPADHIYYYASTMTVVHPPVYAPARIHVTEVDTSSNLSANPVHTDYNIVFYACGNVRSYYAHVQTLSAELQNQLGPINQNCSTYSTGGSTFQYCAYYTNLVFPSGTQLGTAGSTGALDFGSTDNRITPLAFASPQRHYGLQPYTVCPVDYFTTSLKAQMDAMFGNAQNGYYRVIAPVCGQLNHDVVNTAKGNWYHVGSPDSPEDPHLALINNNVYAQYQEISVGTSLPNGGSIWYMFDPQSAGLVNRDFSQVTADGNVYCYDTFMDPIAQLVGLGAPKYILRMTSSTTLRFEKQGTGACGAGPWTFTGNAVDFQR